MIYWEELMYKNISDDSIKYNQNEIFPEKRVKSRATEVSFNDDNILSSHARVSEQKQRYVSSNAIDLEQQSDISVLVGLICDNISSMILLVSEKCIPISDYKIQKRS
jgi:hypothetical protein